MARVCVDVRELEQAASCHWQAKAKLPGPTLRRDSNLLAFYAVECALKARALDARKCHSTEFLPDGFGEDGHDLHEGIKTCRVPAHFGAPPVVRREGGDQLPTSKLHQAWRYGAKLEASGESSFTEWLGRIYDWLKEVKQ